VRGGVPEQQVDRFAIALRDQRVLFPSFPRE
jgi:hypothetical protein